MDRFGRRNRVKFFVPLKFQLIVNCWSGLVVWIPGIPLWEGLLLGCTPRIPNHRAPNQQWTISWVFQTTSFMSFPQESMKVELDAKIASGYHSDKVEAAWNFASFAFWYTPPKRWCWHPQFTSPQIWILGIQNCVKINGIPVMNLFFQVMNKIFSMSSWQTYQIGFGTILPCAEKNPGDQRVYVDVILRKPAALLEQLVRRFRVLTFCVFEV